MKFRCFCKDDNKVIQMYNTLFIYIKQKEEKI